MPSKCGAPRAKMGAAVAWYPGVYYRAEYPIILGRKFKRKIWPPAIYFLLVEPPCPVERPVSRVQELAGIEEGLNTSDRLARRFQTIARACVGVACAVGRSGGVSRV